MSVAAWTVPGQEQPPGKCDRVKNSSPVPSLRTSKEHLGAGASALERSDPQTQLLPLHRETGFWSISRSNRIGARSTCTLQASNASVSCSGPGPPTWGRWGCHHHRAHRPADFRSPFLDNVRVSRSPSHHEVSIPRLSHPMGRHFQLLKLNTNPAEVKALEFLSQSPHSRASHLTAGLRVYFSNSFGLRVAKGFPFPTQRRTLLRTAGSRNHFPAGCLNAPPSQALETSGL